MAGELIIVLEIALFFVFIYFVEKRKYEEHKIKLDRDSIDEFSKFLSTELKSRFNSSKDKYIFIKPEELFYSFNDLKRQNSFNINGRHKYNVNNKK